MRRSRQSEMAERQVGRQTHVPKGGDLYNSYFVY